MDYAYKRSASGDFEAAAEAVERAIHDHGFVVRHVHDLHLTLASKGFPISPIRVYEVVTCEGYWPTFPPGLDLVLPCRVSVCLEDDGVVVAAIRPSLAARVFPEARLEGVADRIEAGVLRVVDDAVEAI